MATSIMLYKPNGADNQDLVTQGALTATDRTEQFSV